jgi:hypothetical protein
MRCKRGSYEGLECMNPDKLCCIGSKVGSSKGNNYRTNFQEKPPYYFAEYETYQAKTKQG